MHDDVVCSSLIFRASPLPHLPQGAGKDKEGGAGAGGGDDEAAAEKQEFDEFMGNDAGQCL